MNSDAQVPAQHVCIIFQQPPPPMLMMLGARDEYGRGVCGGGVVLKCSEESTTSTPTKLNINGLGVSARRSERHLQRAEYRSAAASHL